MSEAEYMDAEQEQDFYTEDCEDYDGDCNRCPYNYSCWSSDYRPENNTRY